MHPNPTDARLLLKDVTTRAKALALLRRSGRVSPGWSLTLTTLAMAAVDAGLEASLWVKVPLAVGCGAALGSLVDAWYLSRRVDALVALTLQQEDAGRAPRCDQEG